MLQITEQNWLVAVFDLQYFCINLSDAALNHQVLNPLDICKTCFGNLPFIDQHIST